MEKSNLLPVETSGVSQVGTLVIELFLMSNYRFRRNILNGKVEFSAKPFRLWGSSTRSTPMWPIMKWCHS